MIEDVANLIKKSIDSSLRDEFDTLHEHRYRYTLSVCRSTLKRNIDEAFDYYIKGGHGLLGDMSIIKDQIEKAHGRTYDEIIHECAEVGVKEKMLDRANVETVWVDTFKGSKVTIKKEDVKQINQHSVEVHLDVGTVGAKGTTSAGYSYNLVNNATKKLYEAARGVAFNEMAKFTEYAAKYAKNDKGETLRNKRTKGGSAKNFSIVKGHGKAVEQFGELRPSGDEQTTVAILTLTKKFKTVASCLPNKKYSGKAGDMVRAARRAIMNHLETNFNLKQYRNLSNTAFDETLIIDLHATDSKGNSEFQKGKYDAKGIRKEVDKYVERSLIPAMTKGLKKNSSEWAEMKGSTPRKDLASKQMQKVLVEKLLGVKTKKSPDFRLKVNKKLLKMAKDAKVSGRKSRTKALKDRTQAGQMKIIGVKAASSYKAKAVKKKSAETAKTAESPIALRNILNEYLPQTVAKNMGSPALNFQTGRFANSARVENVNIGPRGGLNIDYTYMRNPYETFEPGGKQGSVQRDPQKLIGRSIRELALAILGRQPTTLRRT